jgi:oligopeptide/dipeptide ABC transporter ATP-binding protein
MTGPAAASPPLVSVCGLRIQAGSGDQAHDTVRDVSFEVRRGSTLAIVGESGSGKSLTALALMGLLPRGLSVAGGQIEFDGAALSASSEREWSQLRGTRIGMVFQDPLTALNPSMRVGDQVAEMFRRRAGLGRQEARSRAVAAMAEVGIADPEHRAAAYPHQFSGGMRQRIMIAMAIALGPQLLIADEPTTALDVTVQAQIMRLLLARKTADRLTLILISHDLGVVARSADTVVVMYAGRVVEAGPLAEVFAAPAHPYTRALLRSVSDPRSAGERLTVIPGQPPDLRDLPPGCSFQPRCELARDLCHAQVPARLDLGRGRRSACHFAAEVLALSGSQPGGARP